MKAKIRIPDTVKDMSVAHLPFYMALAELTPEDGKINETILDDLDAVEIADLNVLFFGSDPGEFDIYTKASNKQILAEIAKSCTSYDPGEIVPEITINDITYVWQQDYSKMPVSFHRDISRADFQEHPLDLVGLCYVEEGFTYNQLDTQKNIVNPLRERGEVFRKYMSLDKYLDLQGFFLASYSVFRPYLKAKAALKNRRRGIGKKA
jgi:hypothetical protein